MRTALLSLPLIASGALVGMPAAAQADDPVQPPVTANDDYSQTIDMRWGQTYRLDLVANDTDPQGLPLTVESCDPVTNVYWAGSPDVASVAIDGGSILLTTNSYYNGESQLNSFNCYITNGEQSAASQVSFRVHDPSFREYKPLVFKPSIGKPNRFRIINPNEQPALLRYSIVGKRPNGKLGAVQVRLSVPPKGSAIGCVNKGATTITSYVIDQGKTNFVGVDTLFKKIRKARKFAC